MEDPRVGLILPEEPAKLRAETRTLIERSPEEGIQLVNSGHPLSELLWEEWSETLERFGMDRGRFLQITRGYATETRLWVMGERPWDHCIAGLAGRVRRRLPREGREQETSLASLGADR